MQEIRVNKLDNPIQVDAMLAVSDQKTTNFVL